MKEGLAMAEYVERETLKEKIGAHMTQIPMVEENRDMFFHNSGVNCEVTKAMLVVEKEPAADVAPVVHGRWLEADDGDGIVCSVCGTDFCTLLNETEKFNGCPHCLARMDGE